MSRQEQNLRMPGDYSGSFPDEYRAYNTQYMNRLEKIGWQLWDTQAYVSGTTTGLTNFFNVRATPDLSNMETAFQLPAPKAFLIRAIRFYVKQRVRMVSPPTAAPQTGAFDNIAQLINTGVFELIIGNKQYSLNALWTLTAGGGASGSMAAAGDGAANTQNYWDYAQNGISDPRAVYTLSTPLFIPPQMNFKGNVTWPAALTLAGGNTELTFLLDGDQLRPVQ